MEHLQVHEISQLRKLHSIVVASTVLCLLQLFQNLMALLFSVWQFSLILLPFNFQFSVPVTLLIQGLL